jgi:hypothetical protein
MIFVPVVMALVGMMVAWAAATYGQDARRARDQLQINYDRTYWELELDHAEAAHKPAAEIARLEKIVAAKRAAKIISYARYGRQFTSWDGYRYEEIIDEGYVYHQPWQAEKPGEKIQPLVDVGGPERRSKNVVWYPLYPLLAAGLKAYLPLSTANALTAVSWASCLLGSVVMFLYVRRYFYGRADLIGAGGGARAQDTAAIWAVAGLLFGPCAIFLYANFTESLFVLLLALFLYCLQAKWWWRAALVAAVASACRSQGVLFGPILALLYLVRGTSLPFWKRLPLAAVMGVVSAIGLGCYALFLKSEFGDALAFMHAQRYWNVGISFQRILYAADPSNALSRVFWYGFYKGEVDWPRMWEALCLIWPPVVLLVLGWRYLSFELLMVAWMFWGLPYVSNSMAGNPPFDTQWMSMGRFMAVMIPLYVIFGAVAQKRPWLAVVCIVPWTAAFGVFAYQYGNGAWIG